MPALLRRQPWQPELRQAGSSGVASPLLAGVASFRRRRASDCCWGRRVRESLISRFLSCSCCNSRPCSSKLSAELDSSLLLKGLIGQVAGENFGEESLSSSSCWRNALTSFREVIDGVLIALCAFIAALLSVSQFRVAPVTPEPNTQYLSDLYCSQSHFSSRRICGSINIRCRILPLSAGKKKNRQ